MELIPILSLIILVATISTFVLSIGAYVLYKLREKKGKTAEQPKPEAIPAELVTPQMAQESLRMTGSTGLRATYGQSLYSTRESSPMFATDAGTTRPEMRPTVLGLSSSEEAQFPTSFRNTINPEKFETKKNFSRYTTSGYTGIDEQTKRSKINNKEDEEPLRWR